MSPQFNFAKSFLVAILFVVATIGTNNRTNAGVFANQVVSYVSGTTATPGYTNPAVATGSPAHDYTDSFGQAVVSPFNPPYLPSDNVSIGEGGHLTLRFSNYAKPSASGPEIGVFSSGGITDANFSIHQASPVLNPLNGTTFSIGNAVNIDVSTDNILWVGLGSHLLDVPTSGYTDLTDPFAVLPGTALSDFGQPFTGNLSSFNNLTYAQMLTLLNGSGGGTWLDISSTGLSDVGYIRFTLPDDGNPLTELEVKIDAVSVANGFSGAAVPEPSGLLLAAIGAASLLLARQRNRRSR